MKISVGGKGSGESIEVVSQDAKLFEVLTVCDVASFTLDRKRGKREWYASYLCLDVTEATRLQEQLRLFVQRANKEARDE